MDLDVDVAVMNGGGVRKQVLPVSHITELQDSTFGNVACLQPVTGSSLDALEWGAKDYRCECGGFLQVPI